MNWPAKLASIEGASEDQKQLIYSAMDTLNSQMGETVLSKEGDGYPIHIKIVPPSSENPLRVGYAVSTDEQCRIELLNRLFDAAYYLSLLVSVFVHENAHCAGLAHVSTSNEVMSRSAIPFTSYSNSALSRFTHDFLGAITLQE